MPIDYLELRRDGALVRIDDYNERIVITTDSYDGDITHADEDDEGVLAVVRVDPGDLLARLLDELADGGVDVGALLERAEDPEAILLPGGERTIQPVLVRGDADEPKPPETA